MSWAVLPVLPQEVKCVVGFFGNDVYMMAPFKVITECDSKVFGIFYSLNGCITEFIFLDVCKSGTVNCHYIALGGIELKCMPNVLPNYPVLLDHAGVPLGLLQT